MSSGRKTRCPASDNRALRESASSDRPCAVASPLVCCEPSAIVGDAEIVGELRINFGCLFCNLLDHGAARPPFQKCTQPGQPVVRADGVDLDAAVAQITDKSGKVKAFGFVLRE